MQREPTHPTSDDVLDMQQDLRRCALCSHLFPKDEMFHIQLDEPQNWAWVCEGCDEGLERMV